MKGLGFYKWLAGSMNDFTRQFNQHEELFKQAKKFWNNLEGSSTFIIVIFIALGIALAITYYVPYNEGAGRRYRPTHWGLFMLITFIATLLVTFGFEYFAHPPKLDGALMLEFKIALCNAIYAAGLYFIMSIIWCNCGRTNAYRIFKI